MRGEEIFGIMFNGGLKIPFCPILFIRKTYTVVFLSLLLYFGDFCVEIQQFTFMIRREKL